jgi:hypothetical protein
LPACFGAAQPEEQGGRQQAVKNKTQQAGNHAWFSEGHEDGDVKPANCDDVHGQNYRVLIAFNPR